MSTTLLSIELISSFLGFILIYLCVKYNNLEVNNSKNLTIKLSFYKIISILIVILFAIGIVIFATKAAMGR